MQYSLEPPAAALSSVSVSSALLTVCCQAKKFLKKITYELYSRSRRIFSLHDRKNADDFLLHLILPISFCFLFASVSNRITANYDGLSEDCFRLVRTVTHHNHLCKITFYSKKTVSVFKFPLLSLVEAKSQISKFVNQSWL